MARPGWIAAAVLVSFCLSHAEAANGPQKRELAPSNGHYFLVLPPKHDAKKSYDLIVALHGMGDTAENFARAIVSMTPGRETIVAAPEVSAELQVAPNRKGYSWTSNDLARIEETVADATKNFGADPKRVLLLGFSAGCAIGFLAITQKPELFTTYAGLGMAIQSNLKITDEQLKAAAKHTSVYYMVGKQDPNHRVYQPTVDRLTKCGFKLKNEDPDIGHRCTPEVVKNALAFFDETVAAKAKEKEQKKEEPEPANSAKK
ncbi:MAG: hypothetical protein L6R28_17330 [Planctomycetes bacterium]|nr:hypothetical protein [Planctomycetota bacterium]